MNPEVVRGLISFATKEIEDMVARIAAKAEEKEEERKKHSLAARIAACEDELKLANEAYGEEGLTDYDRKSLVNRIKELNRKIAGLQKYGSEYY